MIEQQPIPGISFACGSKQCWGCPASIPYHFGFCEECWAALPEGVRLSYHAGIWSGQPWSGQLGDAIASALKMARRERTPYTPRPKPDGLSTSPPRKGATIRPTLADLGL